MALDIPRLDGRFEVVSDFQPAGDQPAAIEELERRVRRGDRDVVLLGATGTGKCATTAWLIERLQRPTLVMAPEQDARRPARQRVPRAAAATTRSSTSSATTTTTSPRRTSRRPTPTSRRTPRSTRRSSGCGTRRRCRCSPAATSIVVATVSCIYGLGTPQEYLDRSVKLQVGQELERDQLLRRLVDIQYTRNDMAFTRGHLPGPRRHRGDLPGVRGARDPRSSCSVTRSSSSTTCTR